MCATISSADKFAFLFKTNNVANYDLSTVRDTLEDYYGFPAANIIDSTGCGNLTADFASFASTVIGHTPSGKVPPGQNQKNTVFIFIVGAANVAGTGLTDGTNTRIWSDLGYDLDPIYVPDDTKHFYHNSEVHLFLIFPYCADCLSSLVDYPDSSTTLAMADDLTTFTGHVAFIVNWVDTFGAHADVSFVNKLLQIDISALRIHSLSGTSSPFSTFYKQLKNGSPESTTFTPYYPGYPSLEIDDGTPVYKTKDIFLNNIDPETDPTWDLYDNYQYDADNKISVRVHVRGTHPVKEFNVGASVFRNGGGGECDSNLPAERPVTSANLLKPGEDYEYSYIKFFQSNGGTISHRCIKARVTLDTISDASINTESAWDFTNREYEAQLNLDPGGTADISSSGTGGSGTGGAGTGGTGTGSTGTGGAGTEPGSTVAPGEGAVDEADPAGDAEPVGNGTDTQSTSNLKGYFEHVYLIRNSFKTKLEYRYKIPDIIHRYERLFIFRWFVLDPKNRKIKHELSLNRMKDPWFSFHLKPGEEIELMTYFALTGKSGIKGKIDIPFDILVEKPSKNIFGRLPLFKSFRKQFRLYSGVNLVLSKASGDIFVKVFDEKKQSVNDAFVFIKTLNGRQSAVYKTGKEGSCTISGINTGPYKLWAVKDNWRSGVKIINLHNKKQEKIDLLPDIKKT